MLKYRAGRLPQKIQNKKRNISKRLIPFRLSLRYKLAFPTLIIVCVMVFLLFRTTFVTVTNAVHEKNESRLKAIAEVFAETVKVPLILDNQQVLVANIEWMAKRGDVLEVRVEDAGGSIVGGEQANNRTLPEPLGASNFFGVHRINQDTYGVAVPIQAHNRRLGRVVIIFSQLGFEAELRAIFQDRLLLAFAMAILLAVSTAFVTWLAIRPIFNLKQAAEEILAGDLTARARVYSFDEIQDLGDAFNEMVERLARSLDSIRARTEALEESEEKYRLIVDNASDIIFTLTAEGGLVLLNRGFSGCTREELLSDGLPLLLTVHEEESRNRFQGGINEVIQKRKPVTNIAVTHVHRHSQKEIYYLVNFTPVFDHDGKVKLIQGVMRDVTEMRRIELMKDSLIRDVAHELKTPTAKFEMAVTWFEKEIQKNNETEKYFQIISMLKTNIDRLMRTITSIMDLSKLESGMYRVVTEILNVNDVLEQVVQDMDPLCRQKNLKLVSRLSREALYMKGDKDMLYRLFVNLIGNSAKFTENGEISISSHKTPGAVVVAVKDSGPGIEKEFLERVFDRFFQKTASTLGIGVGLTISRDIATIHQGKIWAESEGLGKGATFKVEFPLIQLK